MRILYYLMHEGRPFERKNGSMSSRIASWDYFGNVIAISVSYYKVVREESGVAYHSIEKSG